MALAGAFAVTALAGCGNTGSSAAGTSIAESASAAETTGESTASAAADSTAADAAAQDAPAGTTEVEFWYAGGKTAVNVVQDIIDKYNASQSTYHVSAVTQADYDETYQKLQAGIAGNAAPDLVLLTPAVARNLSDKQLLTDLNPYIDAADDFSMDDLIPVFANMGKDPDGKIFAIPAYGTTQVLYYNIGAFEATGVKAEDIKTWQDLAAAAKKIRDTGKYEYGWEPMWGAGNLIDAAFSNGGKVLSDDGTQVLINSDEWVEVWEAFRTWIHDDKTMAIHSGGQGWEYWYNTIDDVLNDVAGGYTGSSGDQADLDFTKVAAMEQPAWNSDTTSAPAAESLTLSVLESAGDAEKQGAFDFIKYFTNPENQVTWTMSTGYVAVNTKINDNTEYTAYVEENPQAAVPFAQASHGSVYPYDPTNGAILDALKIAADKVEIDGVSAKEALDEAQKTAQAALDEALGK